MEEKKRFPVISAKFGKKISKTAGKSPSGEDINIGFQQPVENRFGNFPPRAVEKYGYPK